MQVVLFIWWSFRGVVGSWSRCSPSFNAYFFYYHSFHLGVLSRGVVESLFTLNAYFLLLLFLLFGVEWGLRIVGWCSRGVEWGRGF